MQPCAPAARRWIHILAKNYNLKSRSIGTNSSRFTILEKTPRTAVPKDLASLQQLVDKGRMELVFSATNLNKEQKQRLKDKIKSHDVTKINKGSKKNRKADGRQDTVFNSQRIKHGSIVGEFAPALTSENIGHRMLSKMGWTDGQKLGQSNTGLEAPLEVVVNLKRAGLGASL